MNKKGDFGWEEISKIILVLVILIILIILVFLYKDKAIEIIDKLKEFIRFGR